LKKQDPLFNKEILLKVNPNAKPEDMKPIYQKFQEKYNLKTESQLKSKKRRRRKRNIIRKFNKVRTVTRMKNSAMKTQGSKRSIRTTNKSRLLRPPSANSFIDSTMNSSVDYESRLRSVQRITSSSVVSSGQGVTHLQNASVIHGNSPQITRNSSDLASENILERNKRIIK
jgi:hypothetical protein